MDGTMTITLDFAVRLRGFLNQFASKCSGCLTRNYLACAACVGDRALRLMNELDAAKARAAKPETYYRANPSSERRACILQAIREAGKPIASRCIVIPHTSRKEKYYLLRTMLRNGILKTTLSKSGELLYFTTNKQTQQTNKKGN